MSVLRYFSNYFPIPDKNLSLAKSIFEIPIELQGNQSIENLIPGYPQAQKLDSFQKKLIPQKVVDTLCLKFEMHAPYIHIIKEKLEDQSISPQEKKIYAVLAVRSASSLLFTQIEKIEPEIFRDFIKALSFASVLYPQPQHINDLFFGVFEKFSFASQLSRIVEYVDVLKDVEQFYSDTKSNCLQAHLAITLNLIDTLFENNNPNNENLISNQFYFTAIIIGKATNPDKELISKLSVSIIKLINHISKNPVSITLNCAVLQLMISLRKHIVFDCTPYMNVLRQMSPLNTIFNTTIKDDYFRPESAKDHSLQTTFVENDEKIQMILDDDKILKFKDLYSLEDANTNPLLIFSKETGLQLSNFDFEIVSNILEILISYIMEEGLNFYAIAIIIISQLTDYSTEIGDYFIKNSKFEVIFPKLLFNPSINSFDTPNSAILNLKQNLFQLLNLLGKNKKTLPLIRQSFSNIVSLVTFQSELFTDLIALAYDNIPQVFSVENANDKLWESIFIALAIQQQNYFDNLKNSRLYRPQLMTIVSKIICLPNAYKQIVKEKYCCEIIVNFLYEPASIPFTTKAISQMIHEVAKNQSIKSFTNLINSIHTIIWTLIPNISDSKSFNLLLTIVDTVVNEIGQDITELSDMFLNTEILSDIISIILNLKQEERSPIALSLGFDLLLKIQQVRNFVFDGIPFTSIAKVANRVGVDSSIYNRIVKVISGGDCNFDRIAVPEAIPLLIISTRGSKEYSSVLHDILRFCGNSVCNRCACLAGHLPAMIFEQFEEEDLPTILKIFELIATTGLNHTALIQFFRQFSSVKANKFNNRVFECIEHLANIVKGAEKPQHFSMILFSSEFSGIQVPELPSINTSDDFMVSANILLDSPNCGRFFFDFPDKAKTSYLTCLFVNKTIVIKYKLVNEEEKIINFNIELPIQKWFNLSVLFRHWDENIAVFIEDNESETIPLKPFPNFPDFTQNMMFNVDEMSEKFFSLQSQEAAVYTRGNWNISSMLKLPEKMNMQTIANWATEHQNDMKNMKRFGSKHFFFDPSNIATKNQIYSGTPIRFFSNFLKVFEASHSINFIISLFGQLDFQCPNLDERRKFFENLLTIVTNLIKKSDIVCAQMLNCHMYSVLAHFLYNSSKSHLTVTIWKFFMEQLTYIKLQPLREMLLKCIIFNADIWRFAPLEVKSCVVSDWSDLVEKSADDYREFISFGYMLTIFSTLIPTFENLEIIIKNERAVTNKEPEDVLGQLAFFRSKILNILKKLLQKPCTVEESDYVYYSIWKCPSVEQIMQFLELGQFAIKQSWFKIDMFPFGETWIRLLAHPIDAVRSKLISIFASAPSQMPMDPEIVKKASFMIATNPINEKEVIDDSEKCFLVNCCRIAIGITERTSLEEMIHKDELIITKILFIKLAAAAMIVSPQRICELFIDFLEKLFQNDKNLANFDLTQFHFLSGILLHSAISKRLNSIPIVAKIVANDPLALQVCIDALSNISYKCHIDIDIVSAELVDKVLDIVMSKPPSQELCIAAGTLSLIIMFHTQKYQNYQLKSIMENCPFKISLEEVKPFSTNLPGIVEIMQDYVKNKDAIPSKVFSKRLDSQGRWIDRKLAVKTVKYMSSLSEKYPHTLDQQIFVLLSLFFTPDSKIDDYKELIPILKDEISRADVNDEMLMFVGYFIVRIPFNSYLKPIYDEVEKKFGQNWSDIKIYMNGYHAFNNYCDQPPSEMNIIDEILIALFKELIEKSAIPSQKEIEGFINEFDDNTNKPLQTIFETSSRQWRTLWASISHERSPFFKQKKLAMHIHYKRFAMYDKMMCPSLLKRNSRFDPHIEASLRRDQSKSFMIRSDSDTFYNLPPDTMKIPIVEEKSYIWKVPCDMIQVDKIKHGTFTVNVNGYTFSSENSRTIEIKHDEIHRIIPKYVLQRQTAFEVYTTARRSYLFNFSQIDNNHNKILNYLKSIPMNNEAIVHMNSPQNEIEKFTTKWQNYEISTFEYLMWLNEFSGRSINNIECYPVFPWIIDKYDIDSLDFNDPSIFRDLSKPIGALGIERLKKLKFMSENSISAEKFLYHNMYSCSVNVLHYLIRLEPFTTAHIQLQDGKFDHPTRIFYSIPESYENVKSSNNNFRELTPEFFFCPEFLKNIDGFDIGCQNGDVILPKWAKTPEEFIYLHKKALESDFVSEHINDWIDLIWGYKQNGLPASESDNTFDPHLYQDVWQKFPSEDDKLMIEQMLHHVGSIPRKLFDQPHKKRIPRNFGNSEKPFCHVKMSENPIIAVKLVGENANDKILLFTLSNNGLVHLCRVTNNNQSISQISKEVYDEINVVATGDKEQIYFAFSTANSSDLICVKSNCSIVKSKSTKHVESIFSLCIHGSKVITGGGDSILVEWDFNEKGELQDNLSIMAHADCIKCCSCQSGFGVVVSCSLDGLLVVSFLSNFSFIRSIDLGLPPEQIPTIVRITSGMGLIVVCASHAQKAVDGSTLIVYTLNGCKVAQKTMQNRISYICTATNYCDIDYVLCVVKEKLVVLYEAFNMKEIGVVFRSDEKITHIGYHRQTDTVTIGDVKGNLFWGYLFRNNHV
ncbi:Beige/BEACH domain containing protein [Trichomonas vaginalis G3]|uniref:Beige/BEACH domain containing protein n=1 Tax=Trichomonas vaginalis (strain ATCC PRA-98 / G3) TaxID=412133 RepID=A2E1G9_TRIV3|nr:beige/BEACH-related family [Trichomonas vaginalis G3]EAY13536.1 Beige/BEACH domain containing protein [Trichomonas vaginalis G3]KAI5529188.1 beige/BEACH-related family [Trichomonas vaginalis G3]|eukprot:XP_001325759.1 Beige/BEACH domain containing protein [Trichomonas vaginalis G3]